MTFLVKLLIKAAVTLGIMFFGYQYILSNGAGGFQIPGLSGMADEASQGISEVGNAAMDKDVTVYQWVDENGVTQFGGVPPTGQGEYTKKSVNGNTNIMSAYKAPQKEESTTQRSRVSSVGNPYSIGGMKNIMDDAKGTTEKMNEQSAKQEDALNDLMKKINRNQQ